MKRWNMFIKKTNRKAGFTLMELLVVVAVLAILSGTAYVAINRSQGQLVSNKVASDLVAIQSALEQFKQDNGAFPVLTDVSSTKNVSCFQEDTSYAHCDSPETFFFQTKVDNDLLTKRYLQEVPLDPHARTHYAYGATADGRYYQLAATKEVSEGVYQAMVVGNLKESAGVLGLSSLIRSFDGPDFVMNGEELLPYSADPRVVSARLYNVDGTATLDGAAAPDGALVLEGQRVAVGAGELVRLYFSDGSVSYLGDETLESELLLAPSSSVEDSEMGLITRIRLKLTGGKIWNKVVRLSSAAEFNIETTSAIAGVRGTEFGLSEDPNTPDSLELVVHSGEVVARLKTAEELDQSAAGTEFDDVIEFTKADTDLDEVDGDGVNFPSYTFPVGGGLIPATTPQFDQFDDYYQIPFSNNIRPRVISFNGNAPAELVFHPFDDSLDVEVINEGDQPVAYFLFGDFTDFTVDPTALMSSPVPLRFRFVNPDTNQYSLPSHPPLTLSDATVLTEDQLLGNFVPGDEIEDNGFAAAVCGDDSVEFPEQCEDGNNVDFDECSNVCQLTGNLLYADYTDGQPNAQPGNLDYSAIGLNAQGDDSNDYDFGAGDYSDPENPVYPGLQVEEGPGNFLRYPAQGHIEPEGSITLALNGSELNDDSGDPDDDPEFGYLLHIIDDNGQDIEIYITATGSLWFEVGGSGRYFTSGQFINALDNLDEDVLLEARWPDLELRLVNEDGSNPQIAPGSFGGMPPDLSFSSATSQIYIGSYENGLPNPVNTQYEGLIKSILVQN